MRKVDDGKRKEKYGIFSGHYVIASSLPPERRPLEPRTLMPKSPCKCQILVSLHLSVP